MKKKLVQVMGLVMVGAFLLTGCGKASGDSGNAGVASEATGG